MNVAEALIDLAVQAGVRHGFSVVGGMSMFLNRAAALNSHLDIHYMHHETGCVAAAEGYSKETEFALPGLAVITSGPAVTNALTGMASAFGDSVPLLVLAGQVKRQDINPFGVRTYGVQEVRQLELASNVTKLALRIESPDVGQAFEVIWEALTRPRFGPVYVEVPLDVQSMDVSDGRVGGFSVEFHQPAIRLSEQTVEAVESCKRPVVLLGNGMKSSNAVGAINRLRELGIPRLYTWLSFDLEDSAEELNMGCPGALAPIHANRILSEADLLVCVGARLDLATTAFQPRAFGEQAHRIIVDIDEKELDKFQGLNNTDLIRADAAAFLSSILPLMRAPDDAWRDWAKEQKAQSLAQEEKRLGSPDRLTVRNVALAMSERSRGVTVIPASSGLAEETLTRFFRPRDGCRFFNGAALGSMGLGLSHGLGASWVDLHREVWVVEADGGLWMQAPQLACLVKAPPRLTLFVLNNAGYASIRTSQRRLLQYKAGADRESGVDLPDFSRVCEALDLSYTRITSLEQLNVLLDAPNKPRVVEIHLSDDDESRGPMLKTQVRNGVPYTPPLGSISW